MPDVFVRRERWTLSVRAERLCAGLGSLLSVGAFGLVALLGTSSAEAASRGVESRSAFDSYGSSYRQVDLPPIAGDSFFVLGDVLTDGRIVATTGDGVFVETGVGTGSFDRVADLDVSVFGGSDPDPAFLTVSPDGSRVALGGGFGKPVAVFSTSALGSAGSPSLLDGSNMDLFQVEHFDAAWRDNTTLAIAAGDFVDPSFVSLLDVTSSPAAPVNPVVLDGILGGSGGVAFDSAGRLYTGNGFGFGGGGSETGTLRVFDPSELSVTTPADFETDGTLLGEVLSANSLSLDGDGNLFVGGGDFGGGDFGYLGVVSAVAIADALSGLGPIDVNDSDDLVRLDPRGDGVGFFGSRFNPVSGELFVTDGATWWATVPSPGPRV